MTTTELKKLTSALRKTFGGKVHHEKIGSGGRYRLEVISPKFSRMSPLRRQDAVWDIVDKAIKPASSLDISLILTHSPGELAETH
jgi:stress-induced morphogen